MAIRPKQGEEQIEDKAQVSTRRLETLADVAAAAARAKRWQARKNGVLDLGEPSEVRNPQSGRRGQSASGSGDAADAGKVGRQAARSLTTRTSGCASVGLK
jgi:hypothetical protein